MVFSDIPTDQAFGGHARGRIPDAARTAEPAAAAAIIGRFAADAGGVESDSDQMSERAQGKSRANPLLRLLERREKLIFLIKQTAALGEKSKKADRRGQREVIDRQWG